MRKQKFIVSLVALFLIIVPVLATTQKVEAAWGNLGVYNMPSKMRGTWVSRDKKSVYNKIRITKNTITLTHKHKAKKIDGKWNLRKVSQKWMDKTRMETRVKSFQYAQNHRYMTVRKDGTSYIFGFGWGVPCNDGDFTLRSKSKSVLGFANVIHQNNFYRVK